MEFDPTGKFGKGFDKTSHYSIWPQQLLTEISVVSIPLNQCTFCTVADNHLYCDPKNEKYFHLDCYIKNEVKEQLKKESEKDPHPWGEFLNARKNAIAWMHSHMNRSDKEIAISLSMDEKQVYLIRINS